MTTTGAARVKRIAAFRDAYRRSLAQHAAQASQDHTDATRLSLLSAAERLQLGWLAYQGPRGGKGWRNSDTGRILYRTGPAPQDRRAAPTVDHMAGKVRSMLAGQQAITPEHVQTLATELLGMTVANITALKKQLGLKASGPKAELARKIAARALGKAPVKAPARQPAATTVGPPAPTPKPPAPPPPKTTPRMIDASQPIGERIQAFAHGEAIRQQVAALDAFVADAEQRWRETGQAMNDMRRQHGYFSEDVDPKVRYPRPRADKEKRERLEHFQELSRQNRQAMRDAQEGVRQRVADMLAAHGERPNLALHAMNLPAHDEQTFQQGMAFVERITSQGFGGSWDTRAVAGMTIPREERQRAHYSDGRLFLEQYVSAKTVVHEYGHWLEDNVPGASAAAREFLKHRVRDEPLRSLQSVHPDGKYEAGEVGRRDRFEAAFGEQAWYVGKYYPDATEIVSMGLELLHSNPVHFAKADPEYFNFIVGILDGSLRKGRDTAGGIHL